MIKIETYQPIEEKGDLRKIFAEKIGPARENIIYLVETLKKDIYHMNNVTILVGKSDISFAGSNSEDRKKARENLEQILFDLPDKHILRGKIMWRIYF